jgi:hypothetical protein
VLPRKVNLVAGVGIAAMGLITACGSGSDPAPASADSPAASSAASTSPSTAAPTTTGALEGTWKADAGELVAANTANLGGTGPLVCRGPLRLTFRADGKFKHGGTATCTVGEQSVSATISTEGDYATSEDQILLSNTRSTGTLDLPGGDVPFPAGLGNGTGTYEVSGDVLTLTFTDPSVGEVTQTWQRAAG